MHYNDEKWIRTKAKLVLLQNVIFVSISLSPDRPNIYSSDSEDAYDSDKEESGAKRLMKAKKIASDDEVGTVQTIYF